MKGATKTSFWTKTDAQTGSLELGLSTGPQWCELHLFQGRVSYRWTGTPEASVDNGQWDQVSLRCLSCFTPRLYAAQRSRPCVYRQPTWRKLVDRVRSCVLKWAAEFAPHNKKTLQRRAQIGDSSATLLRALKVTHRIGEGCPLLAACAPAIHTHPLS